MKFRFRHLWVSLCLSFVLAACGRYEPLPWREISGDIPSIQEVGGKIVSSLEKEIRNNQKTILGRRARKQPTKNGIEKRALRVVIAAFPEARSGVRTGLSEQIEKAVRRAVSGSALFEVVDGGNGVSWQEAGIGSYRLGTPEVEDPAFGLSGEIIFGDPQDAMALARFRGDNPAAVRREINRELDNDHPIRGLWPRVQKGAYGEGSALFAASMLAADAAVYGGYALGLDRIRIWAVVVMNRPIQKRYYRRSVKDVLGTPEYISESRPYLAHSRGVLARSNVPDSWLSSWLPPHPRVRPRHPSFWAKPTLKVVFDQIDSDGRRYPLNGGAIFGPDVLIVGQLAVSSRRHVFGFALDDSGRVEEVFRSAKIKGTPAEVNQGKVVHFTARLLPPGRTFRVYFVSSPSSFDTNQIVSAARRRLGVSEGRSPGAVSYRDVVRGAPRISWFVPPGQDRLILDSNWDQHVFWFHRVSQ